MESSERQGRATQVAAWLSVVAIHMGLFWLLAYQGRTSQDRDREDRLRLVFIQPVLRPLPSPPSPSPLSSSDPLPAQHAAVVHSIGPRVSVTPSPLSAHIEPAPAAAPDKDWMEQVRQAARQQAPASFVADPLRSRRVQLPGGESAGRFSMRKRLSGSQIASGIGQFLGLHPPGYNPDPCPRIRSNIPGLLTATSDHERELLDEELRRDREYCRP